MQSSLVHRIIQLVLIVTIAIGCAHTRIAPTIFSPEPQLYCLENDREHNRNFVCYARNFLHAARRQPSVCDRRAIWPRYDNALAIHNPDYLNVLFPNVSRDQIPAALYRMTAIRRCPVVFVRGGTFIPVDMSERDIDESIDSIFQDLHAPQVHR